MYDSIDSDTAKMLPEGELKLFLLAITIIMHKLQVIFVIVM
jgi:hypothetical protein